MNRHAYAPANRRRREDLKFDSLFSKETTGLLLKDVAYEPTGDGLFSGVTTGSSALPGSYPGQRKICGCPAWYCIVGPCCLFLILPSILFAADFANKHDKLRAEFAYLANLKPPSPDASATTSTNATNTATQPTATATAATIAKTSPAAAAAAAAVAFAKPTVAGAAGAASAVAKAATAAKHRSRARRPRGD